MSSLEHPGRALKGIDTEWVAFASGLKPMVRRSAQPTEADGVEARLRALGAPVVLRSRVMSVGGRDAVVLYAARRSQDAEAVRALEASVTHSASDAGIHREIGRRLGFPVCCTEAFCARIERGVDRLEDNGPGGLSEDYVAMRSAWVEDAGFWVNPLLMTAGVQLVSFYPCRYDCAVATRYAQAVYAKVYSRDRQTAVALRERLSRAVVVAHDGARVTVLLTQDREITAAEGVTESGSNETLAGAVVGKRVSDVGRVVSRVGDVVEERAPWWCVDFREKQ